MILKLAVLCSTQKIPYKAKCKDNDINGLFVSKTGLIDGTHVQESIVQMEIDDNYTLFFTATDSHRPTFLGLQEHVHGE